MKKQHKILDSAISLEVLKQDLGLLPKPRENWNTIEPVECGHYIAAGIEYVFKDGQLVEATECKEEECSEKKNKKSNCETCTKDTCSAKEGILKGLEEYKKERDK